MKTYEQRKAEAARMQKEGDEARARWRAIFEKHKRDMFIENLRYAIAMGRLS